MGCEFEFHWGLCGKTPTAPIGIERPSRLQRYDLCREHAEAAVVAKIGIKMAEGQ
jgi:hypothetical protein